MRELFSLCVVTILVVTISGIQVPMTLCSPTIRSGWCIDETVPAALSNGAQIVESSESAKPWLLIITHEDFESTLAPLVDWKERTGYNVELRSWQYFTDYFLGWDEAEDIKLGIYARHAAGHADYVLLVGDVDHFPVRYVMTDREQNDSSMNWGYGAYYACDLYYADVHDESGQFSSWDYDDDHIYGELYGEWFTDHFINVDHLDMVPDLAVGRIPASDAGEVQVYVDRVIDYEWNGAAKDGGNDALLIVPNSPDDSLDEEFLGASETIAETVLNPAGFDITRYYDPVINDLAASLTNGSPTESAILDKFHSGLCFVNYGGHGNFQCWDSCFYAWSPFSITTPQELMPIVFSTGCGTGKFCYEPPYEPYVDIYGTSHTGIYAGELWPVVGNPTLPPPDCLQIDYIDSMAEVLLNYYFQKGAIGYIGCVTGAQVWSKYLNTFFYQSYAQGCTLGEMWAQMVTRYCDEDKDTLGPIGRGETSLVAGGNWFTLAGYHQPMKFLLFGDPSLRIGGLTNRPPWTLYIPPPLTLDEGQEHAFDDSDFGFYDPESQSLTFRWDFDGDGTWDTTWLSGNAVHAYPDDFDGFLRVQALDGEYLSEVESRHITVMNVEPSPTINADTSLEGGDTVGLSVDDGDPGEDTFTYAWEFGSGATPETSTVRNPLVTFGGPEGRFFSSEPKLYKVNVTVTDDDGGVGTAQITIEVSSPSLFEGRVEVIVLSASIIAAIVAYAIWQIRLRKVRGH